MKNQRKRMKQVPASPVDPDGRRNNLVEVAEVLAHEKIGEKKKEEE